MLRSRERTIGALSWLALVAFGIGIVGAAGRASQHLLWSDELFTMYVSQLPPATMWRALASGIDLQPPLSYLLTRGILLTVGYGLVAMRLPSLVGFAIGCLAVGQFVRRRVGPLPAATALLLPFVTLAYDYAIEARPYSLLFGTAGLALLSWQRTGDAPHRKQGLLALALVTAISTSLHYYGCLVVVPIAAGELTRTSLARRWAPGVWIALVAGVLPLAAFLPLMQTASTYAPGFWTRPSFGQLPYAYRVYLYPVLVPAAIALVALAAFAPYWRSAAVPPPPDGAPGSWASETVACTVLFLLPVPALLVGFTSGAYHVRYSIQLLLGFAGLAGMLLGLSRSTGAAAVVVIVLSGWVAARGIGSGVPLLLGTAPPDILARHPALTSPQAPPALPIFVSDDVMYIQLQHYCPASLASRLRIAVLPHRSESFRDSSERAMRALSRWHPIAIESYEELRARSEPFLVYGDVGWLQEELVRDGARLQLVTSGNGHELFLVTPRS